MRSLQAAETRRRIAEAAGELLAREGYGGMTIEAIADRAGVSAQTFYAIFKSKAGVLAELVDRATFGAEYEEAVRQAMSAPDPEARLRLAARVARQIHEAQSAAFDLLRGAGVVAPELAGIEKQREWLRYEREETMVASLRDAKRLRPELSYRTARDILWMLTGRDVYRMLVRERVWSPQKYEHWLADMLVRALLAPRRRDGA
jgi:AcrR family transcriptional regulator